MRKLRVAREGIDAAHLFCPKPISSSISLAAEADYFRGACPQAPQSADFRELRNGEVRRRLKRDCMKSGRRVVIHYSSTHEKTLPNGSLRHRMQLHRASHASSRGICTPKDPRSS